MDQKLMQDRRGFLKGVGATALGVAALGAFGCAPGAAAEPGAGVDEISWDAEYDVIVAGAGMAGVAAAITVAREGDGATCLLLEKDVAPNGNSPFCAGFMCYVDDAEAATSYLTQMIGSSTPEDVIRAFSEGMKENKEWILSLGAKEDELKIGEPKPNPDNKPKGEYPEFENSYTMGSVKFLTDTDETKHIHKFCLDLVNESDVVDYKASTPLESLVQDPKDKTIIGVVAGGSYYKAKKGVIMCTGGFESDPEMLVNYTGVRGYPKAGKANTGDGHRACAKVGADFWHMHGGALYWLSCRDKENTKFISPDFNFSTKEHGITVGTNGRRFYNDFDNCNNGNKYLNGLDLRTNVGYRHGITQFGGEWGHLPMPETSWFIFDADGLANGAFPADVSADPVTDGWAYTADTLEGLAEEVGVPADELVATVATWNEFCDAGVDKAFYRPAETMVKIANPPYYAMRCVPTLLNTDGGPVRSAKGEILDPDGVPIPHLYSAGEFGSVWGHLYQGSGNIGECAAFGRISARSALSNE